MCLKTQANRTVLGNFKSSERIRKRQKPEWETIRRGKILKKFQRTTPKIRKDIPMDFKERSIKVLRKV